MNGIYMRFDKSLDYKLVVNDKSINEFLEGAWGEKPKMVSPTKFTFDRDRLCEFITEEFKKSEPYIIDIVELPSHILESYYNAVGDEGSKDEIYLIEFEPEILLDDHLVTINQSGRVLGVFATEDDFRKIVYELNK